MTASLVWFLLACMHGMMELNYNIALFLACMYIIIIITLNIIIINVHYTIPIRKYGSAFYIGIAIVILPYFDPMGKLKFQFSLSINLTSTNTKVENILKANDIWKKSRKACKTGVKAVSQ